MLLFIFSFLLLCQSFNLGHAAFGFDTALTVTAQELKCLKNNGYSFFIARVYRSLGKVDDAGIQNILTARHNGFTEVDGYIFPCLSTSCPSAATQVTDALNALKAKNATIGRFWLDIEDFAWPSNPTHNRQFILDLANTATKMGYKVGVYTMKKYWKNILGDESWSELSKYPLWWTQYNGAYDLTTGWSPFGGWKAPVIHQVTGSSNECGLAFDKNFK